MTADLIQGSDEWRRARCGSLGASQVSLALARTKTGWGASRENIRAQLIAERLTGVPVEGFTNAEMRYGTETEPEARIAYEAHTGYLVTEVGLFKHPRLAYTHASPDGLIDNDGLLELKCPNTATHIDTLLSEQFDSKYILQCQWQMACTGRKWVDLCSFDKRMPDPMRLFIQRVKRDDAAIKKLEDEVELFLREVATCYMALAAKFDADRAA